MKIDQLTKALNDEENKNKFSSFDIANYHAGSPTSSIDLVPSTNVVLWAGPPLLRQAVSHTKDIDKIVRQVGLVTSLSISANKQLIPWSEFGDKYSHHVPGKIMYSIACAQILSNKGDSLYGFYSWLATIMDTLATKRNLESFKFVEDPGQMVADASAPKSLSDIFQYHNIGSELFNAPFGLLMIYLDNKYMPIKSEYAENCKIAGKGTSISDSPFLMENVQIICSRILPAIGLKVNSTVGTSKKKNYLVVNPNNTYNERTRQGGYKKT